MTKYTCNMKHNTYLLGTVAILILVAISVLAYDPWAWAIIASFLLLAGWGAKRYSTVAPKEENYVQELEAYIALLERYVSYREGSFVSNWPKNLMKARLTLVSRRSNRND